MTTTPDLTPPTTPDPTPGPGGDVAALDTHLTGLAVTSADMLTGLIAAGMLHVAGRPERLPEEMWPHLAAGEMRAVWETALAVGYRAGKLAGAPRWHPEALDRLRDDLMEAGYVSMGARVAVTAAHGRPPTADTDARDGRAGTPGNEGGDGARARDGEQTGAGGGLVGGVYRGHPADDDTDTARARLWDEP